MYVYCVSANETVQVQKGQSIETYYKTQFEDLSQNDKLLLFKNLSEVKVTKIEDVDFIVEKFQLIFAIDDYEIKKSALELLVYFYFNNNSFFNQELSMKFRQQILLLLLNSYGNILDSHKKLKFEKTNTSPPPIPAGSDIQQGMDPSYIKDKEKRQIYEKAIADYFLDVEMKNANYEKLMQYSQFRKQFVRIIKEFIVKSFKNTDEDNQELRKIFIGKDEIIFIQQDYLLFRANKISFVKYWLKEK